MPYAMAGSQLQKTGLNSIMNHQRTSSLDNMLANQIPKQDFEYHLRDKNIFELKDDVP